MAFGKKRGAVSAKRSKTKGPFGRGGVGAKKGRPTAGGGARPAKPIGGIAKAGKGAKKIKAGKLLGRKIGGAARAKKSKVGKVLGRKITGAARARKKIT